MSSDSVSKVSLAIVAVAAVAASAYFADTVLAPLTLALFIIALVWPLQRWLQQRLPGLLALALTMTLTILTMLAFASLVAWGFGRVGRSLIAIPPAIRRSSTQPSPGSTTTTFPWRDCGPSISTSAGCWAGSSRLPAG